MHSYREQVRIISNLLMVVDCALFIAGVETAKILFLLLSGSRSGPTLPRILFSVVFLVLVNNYIATRWGFYSDKRPASTRQLAGRLALLVAADFIALGLALFLLDGQGYPRLFFLLLAGVSWVYLLLSRILLERYLSRREKTAMNCRQILLVGTDFPAEAVQQALANQKSWGHLVIGYLQVDPSERNLLSGIPCLGTLADLRRALTTTSVDEVIFAITRPIRVDLTPCFQLCEEMGVPVRIVPSLYQPDATSTWVAPLMGIPTICRFNPTISASGLLYKRILDICGGAMGAAFFLLVLPFVGLAIKLDSPGPILFRQKRVGKNGRVFHLLKFRSMRADAEAHKKELIEKNEMQGAIFKISDDPRVTKVGGFLRRTSLDEVPQFLNVLRGEMSLVGTRPPTLDEVERYTLWHRRRISIKPGITGLWQISGRNRLRDFNEIVALDLKYIDNWRFLRDISILLATVRVVLARKGAH